MLLNRLVRESMYQTRLVWGGSSSRRAEGRSSSIKTRLTFALDHWKHVVEFWKPLLQLGDSRIELLG